MIGNGSEEFRLLLLSGGIDSAALAKLIRPDHALFIDYGQRPAPQERRSSRAVARQLGIPYGSLSVGLGAIGAGMLNDEELLDGAPSPEWWPFRNQLLVTCAAAWAVKSRGQIGADDRPISVLVGSVRPDGERHADGRPAFYEALDVLLRFQEGNISVSAPALEFDTPELIRQSAVDDATLGWTHSCHRADIPCDDCPGCFKRSQVLAAVGMLS